MGRFSTDADLLGYEPDVFIDLPFASQRKLRITDGVVSGTTLTSATGGFTALSANDVAIIEVSPSESQSHPIASVTSDTTLVLAGKPAGLSASANLIVTVRTLAPQAALVHDELLRSIGIDTDDADAQVAESSIVSRELMRRLESLGVLARAFTAAAAITGDNSGVGKKAEEYAARFRRSMAGAQVLLDLDGDGIADVWRTPGIAMLVRV